MNILVQRMWWSPKTYIGSLFLERIFECYTGENVGTLIPSGGPFPVIPDTSWHFGAIFPHIIVPGRSEIMFHVGNYPFTESKGCILVGQERAQDMVVSSKQAFIELANKVCQAWARKEDVILTITQNGGV